MAIKTLFMNKNQQKWVYFIFLSFIWGSSFILIKKGLIELTPTQVGALRILIAGIFLLITGFKSLKKIENKHWKFVLYSAILGTFLPAFLFAYAISGIDSSVASILNSLTPLNTLIVGTLLFNVLFKKQQFTGILVGLSGTCILISEGIDLNPNQNYWLTFLPVASSIGYAFNVNIIKKHLQDLDPLAITTGNFLLIFIPTFFVLVSTGFFSSFELNEKTGEGLFYIIVLAIIGTGIAKVMFNKLIHISSPVFSTSVTYLIPVIAIAWGVFDEEKLSLIQLFAGGIILFGVWLANRNK